MIKLRESNYDYKGYKIINNNNDGIWKIVDSYGKTVGQDFSTDVDAQEYIDGMLSESISTEDDYFESSLSEIRNLADILAREADMADRVKIKRLAVRIVDLIDDFNV